MFPTGGPKALNLSTRGNVETEDGALIGGFIVTGTENIKVALRVLGPSSPMPVLPTRWPTRS